MLPKNANLGGEGCRSFQKDDIHKWAWLWSRNCFKIMPFDVMQRVARFRQRQLSFLLRYSETLVENRRSELNHVYLAPPFNFIVDRTQLGDV